MWIPLRVYNVHLALFLSIFPFISPYLICVYGGDTFFQHVLRDIVEIISWIPCLLFSSLPKVADKVAHLMAINAGELQKGITRPRVKVGNEFVTKGIAKTLFRGFKLFSCKQRLLNERRQCTRYNILTWNVRSEPGPVCVLHRCSGKGHLWPHV